MIPIDNVTEPVICVPASHKVLRLANKVFRVILSDFDGYGELLQVDGIHTNQCEAWVILHGQK